MSSGVPDFPTLSAPGTTPKITSIFDFSAEALGQLRLWLEQNPPAIGISSIIGSSQFQGGVGTTIALDPFFSSKSQTNWSSVGQNSTQIYAAALDSTGAQNAQVTWSAFFPGGIFTLEMYVGKGASRGIITVKIDGTSVGTIDTYNAVDTDNQLVSLTGVSIAAGLRDVTLLMATKNAASASYQGTINRIQFRRTA